jgi:hypothetical protein
MSKGIATHYVLVMLLGSLAVGVLTYQVYRSSSVLTDYEPPTMPLSSSTGVLFSICENAQKYDLCGGLDIAFGIGYRKGCCLDFKKCCE